MKLLKNLKKSDILDNEYILHTEIESGSMIGEYGKFKIFKHKNKEEFVCTCPAFLKYGSCKHLKNLNLESGDKEIPSTVQDKYVTSLLRELGLKPSTTRSRRLFQLAFFAELQDLEIKDVLEIAEKFPHGFIPLRLFGTEFEGGLPPEISPDDFVELIKSEGMQAVDVGSYSRTAYPSWRVGRDSSIDLGKRNLIPIEIATPKLYGASYGGLKEVERMLSIWNRLLNEYTEDGIGVNKSCGVHVHISVYDLSNFDIFKAALIFYLFQDYIFSFVPPSRRGGRYSHYLDHEDLYSMLDCRYWPEVPTRYVSFNTIPVGESNKRTVEFRLFNGTTDYLKAMSYILFSLCFIERIKLEKSIFEIEKVDSVEYFLKEFLKMKGHPLLEKASDFLIDRFYHFRAMKKESSISEEEIARRTENLLELLTPEKRTEQLIQFIIVFTDRLSAERSWFRSQPYFKKSEVKVGKLSDTHNDLFLKYPVKKSLYREDDMDSYINSYIALAVAALTAQVERKGPYKRIVFLVPNRSSAGFASVVMRRRKDPSTNKMVYNLECSCSRAENEKCFHRNVVAIIIDTVRIFSGLDQDSIYNLGLCYMNEVKSKDKRFSSVESSEEFLKKVFEIKRLNRARNERVKEFINKYLSKYIDVGIKRKFFKKNVFKKKRGF